MNAVHGDVFVPAGQAFERLDDTAAYGIITRFVSLPFLLIADRSYRVKIYVFRREHFGKLFESKHARYDTALFGFALFGDTRSDEHHFGFGITLLQKARVRHHGRRHGREIFERFGIIQLYHPVNGGTGGGYEILVIAACKKLCVFGGDNVCAYSRFFRSAETELGERYREYAEIGYAETAYKRRSDARYYRLTAA